MTELNIMGTPVSTDPNLCIGCKLAKMLETGVIASANDGHASCEGTSEHPCSCTCDYAQHRQCKECGRKVDPASLDDKGQCADRRDCANAILAAAASKRAAKAARTASAPPKRSGGRPSGVSGPKPDCHCGCGEQTGGGTYRPGHDARHVSQLTAKIRSGDVALHDAVELLPSDKLRDKLRKAVGA